MVAFSSHLEGGEHRWNWRRAFTIFPGSLSRQRGLVPVNDVEYRSIILQRRHSHQTNRAGASVHANGGGYLSDQGSIGWRHTGEQ